MGFLFGFLMFLGTYLLIGPAIMNFYCTHNATDKSNSEKTKLNYFSLGFIAAYIVIWIIFLNIDSAKENLTWVIIGAIGGFIGAIITFINNKDETLFRTHPPVIQKEIEGSEQHFNQIIRSIERDGIDFVLDGYVPPICEVMKSFDKQYVDYIIDKYNPNLNLMFKNEDGTIISTPLDKIGMATTRVDMFNYLLKKEAISANYHMLILSLVHNNKYDMLSSLLSARKIDLNKPLSTAIPEFEFSEDDPSTILDFAIDIQANNLIQQLLKDHGARSFKIHF